jgi:hypothetical protein
MRNRALRSLVLACSLLLVLPQGWCCMLASQMATTTATATPIPVSARGCCDCCKQDTQSKPQSDKPFAPPASSCCCSDQQALPASVVSIEQPDAGLIFVAVLPLLDSLLPLGSVIGDAVFHPPAYQRHVFKCVWLC